MITILYIPVTKNKLYLNSNESGSNELGEYLTKTQRICEQDILNVDDKEYLTEAYLFAQRYPERSRDAFTIMDLVSDKLPPDEFATLVVDNATDEEIEAGKALAEGLRNYLPLRRLTRDN